MSGERPIKLLMLGAMAVGKSSLARRLSFDTFDHDYKSTIGVQLHKIDVDLGDRSIPVVLWDTDGDLESDALTSVYARGASGALIIGDVQRPKTIETVATIADAMDDHLPGRPSVCVFNKIDIVPPNPADEAHLLQNGHTVCHSSALTGAGVTEALHALVRNVVNMRGAAS